MLKSTLSLFILGTSIALSACNGTASNTAAPTHLIQLQSQHWVLTHLGTSVLQAPSSNAPLPYLQFNAITRQVSGSDGCNRIAGSYIATGQQLAFSKLVSTKMMCLDANMLLASQFTDALGQVSAYKIQHKTLKLLDHQGHVLMQLSQHSGQP